MSNYRLPPGWKWCYTRLNYVGTLSADPRHDETHLTITALFDVDDPALTPIYAHPTASLPFRADNLMAKWSVDYGNISTLLEIALNGPVITNRASTSKLVRRGSYVAFRNEIALARADAPAGRSAAIPTQLVRTLDDWAAVEGNLPVVSVQ